MCIVTRTGSGVPLEFATPALNNLECTRSQAGSSCLARIAASGRLRVIATTRSAVIDSNAIMSNILVIRGHRVLLDSDLAALYQVETKALTRAVRSPRERLLPRSERLRVLALDVTDPESVRQAVGAAGPIDVLVNNAGIGVLLK